MQIQIDPVARDYILTKSEKAITIVIKKRPGGC